MRLLKEARKFIIKQRIKELENAINHWPNSKHADDRASELSTLRIELSDFDEEK